METELQTKRLTAAAKPMLFAAALIWGSSFVVIKDALNAFPPFYLLAIRFTVAGLILLAVFRKSLPGTDRGTVARGCIAGVMLAIAYALQTVGITYTTPGKNAFLTAVYCVLVPFIHRFTGGGKLSARNYIAAFLCLGGIGFISLSDTLGIELGDGLTLISGVCYAVHIVLIFRFSKGRDMGVLTAIQFLSGAVLLWAAGLFTESFPTAWDFSMVWRIAYLTVAASAVAMLFQNIGQKYTSPASASLILSLEAVFAVLFSVLFYGEELTVKLIVGFILVFIAVLVSEIRPEFLKKRLKQ